MFNSVYYIQQLMQNEPSRTFKMKISSLDPPWTLHIECWAWIRLLAGQGRTVKNIWNDNEHWVSSLQHKTKYDINAVHHNEAQCRAQFHRQSSRTNDQLSSIMSISTYYVLDYWAKNLATSHFLNKHFRTFVKLEIRLHMIRITYLYL